MVISHKSIETETKQESESRPDLSDLLPSTALDELTPLLDYTTSLKKQMKPLEQKLALLAKEKKIYDSLIAEVLTKFQSILPKQFQFQSIPITYVEGREEISEIALLESGVDKSIIDRCKIKGKGYYLINKRKGKEADS